MSNIIKKNNSVYTLEKNSKQIVKEFDKKSMQFLVVKAKNKEEIMLLRQDPRKFLRSKGVKVITTEPMVQMAECRDPNWDDDKNVLFIRKTCHLAGKKSHLTTVIEL